MAYDLQSKMNRCLQIVLYRRPVCQLWVQGKRHADAAPETPPRRRYGCPRAFRSCRKRRQWRVCFTLVVFYRGLHCPICAKAPDGAGAPAARSSKSAVSRQSPFMDEASRAAAMAAKVKAAGLRIGYGLTLASARAWGLYLSESRGKTSIGVDEPAKFSRTRRVPRLCRRYASTMARFRRCRSPAPALPISFARWISRSLTTTRRAVNTAAGRRVSDRASDRRARNRRRDWPNQSR